MAAAAAETARAEAPAAAAGHAAPKRYPFPESRSPVVIPVWTVMACLAKAADPAFQQTFTAVDCGVPVEDLENPWQHDEAALQSAALVQRIPAAAVILI